MRIARVHLGSTLDFAVAAAEGPWTPVSSLGLDLRDTAEVIAHDRTLRAHLAAGRGRVLEGDARLAAPVVRPSKMLAIGLNYMDHIRETKADAPERPVVFGKFPNTVNGPYDPIVIDPETTEMGDYEVELAVVIGRRARIVSEEDVPGYVYGYLVGNDVSARDWQRRDPQFARSKSYDTFCPLGPWITTADEIGDPQALPLRSIVNGQVRQNSTTKEMIFSVAKLVAFLSRTMTLEPGDVILSGTPHGVGFAMDPPVFLQPGDVVRCEIDGLGAIENRVTAPR